MFRPPPAPRRGEPLRNEWGRDVVDMLRMLSSAVGSEMELQRTGRHVTPMADLVEMAVAKTTSVITAMSGLTPGTGTAEVLGYVRSTNTLQENSLVLDPVLNAFEEIANDTIVIIARFLDAWWILPAGSGGGGGGGTLERCQCPESTYEVTARCGSCSTMPKYWWLTISAASDGTGSCSGTACSSLVGKKIRLEHTSGCTWFGQNSHCMAAELAYNAADDEWVLTVWDKNDCELAVLRLDADSFACCASNSGWTNDTNVCTLTISIAPDPCTCCPDGTCPPGDDVPLCKGTSCCPDITNCTITVTVSNLATPPPIPPDPTPPTQACGGMNGVYAMVWAEDCTWTFFDLPGSNATPVKVQATLTLSGEKWTLRLDGPDGQVAVFESADPDCGPSVDLIFNAGSSSCTATSPDPSASFTLNVS